MHLQTELLWLAESVVLLGSFGLGLACESWIRDQRSKRKPEPRDRDI